MVNSYMLRDVWKSEDRTRMGTFVGDRGNPISDMGLIEFSRHRAWRVKQLMDYIINSAKYGEQPESTAEILRVMDAAQRELAQAKAIISGETADKFVYKFDEVSEKKKGAVPEQPRM